MVASVFHVIVNIVIANRLFKTRPHAKIAMIIVAVLPDLDLLGSMIIYLLTQDPVATAEFHRTITHSLIIFGIIFVIGCLLFLTDRLFFDSSRPWILDAIIGSTLGLTVHVGLDLVYFSGVMLLWPLVQEQFAFFPYSFETFSNDSQKLLSALDFFVDLGIYLIFYDLAVVNQTDSEKLTILKWLALVYGIWGLIFLGLALFPINRNDYIILQYILGGAVFLTVSIFLPTVMKETMLIQSDFSTRFNLEKIAIIGLGWILLIIPLLIIPNVEFILVEIYWLGIITIELLPIILGLWILYRQRRSAHETVESNYL
ncbi:MAG: metal-dependent hydrolase [Candidatus Hodarchaeota archaeon]